MVGQSDVRSRSCMAFAPLLDAKFSIDSTSAGAIYAPSQNTLCLFGASWRIIESAV